MGLAYDGCHLNDNIYVTGGSQASSTNEDAITIQVGATGTCTGFQPRLLEGELNNNINDNTILYPNPFTNHATLVIDSKVELKNASFIIYDLCGKIISEVNNITAHNINIERRNILSGIYFYKLVDNNNFISSGKIIIQKE